MREVLELRARNSASALRIELDQNLHGTYITSRDGACLWGDDRDQVSGETLFEQAPVAMVMIDGSGQVHHLNAAAEGLFGYSKSDLVGRSMEILVPEIVRGKHKQLREGSFSSPVSRPMGKGRRLSRRHKDGHEIPVSVGLNPVTIGSNPVVVIASFVDNSAQERAQRAELLSLSVHRMFGVSRTRRTRLPFARATFAVSLGIAWGDVILNSTPRLEPSSAPSRRSRTKPAAGRAFHRQVHSGY